MTKRIAGNPEFDDKLPKVELELGGKKFFLCFTFAALMVAQAKLRQSGIKCNLFHSLDLQNLDPETVPPLLFAALLAHNPDLEYVNVLPLISMQNVAAIYSAIVNAYLASLSEPEKKENPPQPE
jgi:hypothetical protein